MTLLRQRRRIRQAPVRKHPRIKRVARRAAVKRTAGPTPNKTDIAIFSHSQTQRIG
jgi:hypothetical protein